ncbi:hypothetical protein BC829DRAFT_162529 [Chytridium lagenaria]|nr:hypothetical protein BC829DRAFT_162529 [Chytridium lagenaria]
MWWWDCSTESLRWNQTESFCDVLVKWLVLRAGSAGMKGRLFCLMVFGILTYEHREISLLLLSFFTDPSPEIRRAAATSLAQRSLNHSLYQFTEGAREDAVGVSFHRFDGQCAYKTGDGSWCGFKDELKKGTARKRTFGLRFPWKLFFKYFDECLLESESTKKSPRNLQAYPTRSLHGLL